MGWEKLIRKLRKGLFGNIRWSLKLVVLACYIIPILIDSPDGAYEFVWILYLVPPLVIAYYGGLKGAVISGAVSFALLVIYEVWESATEVSYNLQNVSVVVVTLASICITAGGVGILVDRMRNQQEQLEARGRELKEAMGQIALLAYYDNLTGLPNLNFFNSRLADMFTKKSAEGHRFAICFMDLDRFKWINDTIGHEYGNNVLKLVATRLQGRLTKTDTLARTGGDEFTILFDQVEDKGDLVSLAKNILSELHKPFYSKNSQHIVSASLGLAVYPEDGQTPEELMTAADLALFDAKKQGKNRFVFYRPELKDLLSGKLEMENGLRNALRKQELYIEYQPLVDINTQRVTGVEALVRWHHPELGLVSPGKFIPLAEETGLIIEIGSWVLEQACLQAKHWERIGFDISIAVNISLGQFQQGDFSAVVEDILARTQLKPDRLELEITENVALSDPEQVIAKLTELRAIGVRVSIDDFGTGYCSLSYLRKFPINTLKIDQSFIKESSVEKRSCGLVEGVIAMAKNLDLRTVAEGVEKAEQLAILKRLQCDFAQGYLFSKPVAPSECEQLFARELKF